ncbi:MAG: hypothetical protein ACLFP8_07295 [Alphaproteobacteria bacterium]
MKIKGFLDRLKRLGCCFYSNKGFSLMEAAIAVVLVGLFVIPMFYIQKVQLIEKALKHDQSKLSIAKRSLNQYFDSGNSVYPCPADLTLKQGDAGYGASVTCNHLPGIKHCHSGAWLTHGGICKTSNGPDAVLIGGFPFAEMGMRADYSTGYWNNKIIYAISYSQTDPATYSSVNGGHINVMYLDDDRNPTLSPDDYDFFLFTTGRSAVGGFNNQGVRLSDCDGEGYDLENCDFDEVFFSGTGIFGFRSYAYSDVAGERFFDDTTAYQQNRPVNTWFQHEDNALYGTDPENATFVLTDATRVGIGTSEPEHSLHIDGRVKSSTGINPDDGTVYGGNLQSDNFCDSDGTCFNPEIITGDVASMKCEGSDPAYNAGGVADVNRGVMAIRQGSVMCGSGLIAVDGGDPEDPAGNGRALAVDTNQIVPEVCPDMFVVTGIGADGRPVCSSF